MTITAGAPVISPYSQGMDATGHSLQELFPDVDPEFEPYGHRVLIQVRRVFKKSRGGIILSEETKQNEAYNIQVARVVKCGPLAFKRRDTAEPWPEGVWASEGDFVKILRFGGDKWSVPMDDDGEPVVFRLVEDRDLLGKFTGNPLAVKAYIE